MQKSNKAQGANNEPIWFNKPLRKGTPKLPRSILEQRTPTQNNGVHTCA